MTRVRKVLAVLTLAFALTAGPAAPASADPGEESKAAICEATTEAKYNWGFPFEICLS